MAEEKKAEGAEVPKKKLNLAKFADLGFAILNLCVLGGGAFLTYKNTIAYTPPSIREPAAAEALKKEKEELEKQVNGPILYRMEAFNVNLAGTPQKVVRVELSLEMLDQDGFEDVVKNVSHERDMIVALLNKKEFSELESLQGKLFLKNEIASEINKSLKTGLVKDVYFDKFLVQ
jgi:flagellar FliL protein